MTDRNCKIRFAYNSFVKGLDAADITSMETVDLFDEENAVTDIRTKPWKPKGNFEITAANQNLYINDGAPKTVALTIGEYTYATLAAHIQTKLNAASSLWTCSYDFNGGTFKFSIGHTGSATLRFSSTSNAVWDTLGFVGSIDVVGTSWFADEQRNHTSEWIEFDLGQSKDCGFFAAFSDANDYFPISSSNTLLKLMADDIPNNWAAPALEIDLDLSDTGVYRFLDDQTDYGFRYWRFKFIDRENPAGPEGFPLKIWLGDYVTFTNSNVAQGFSKTLVDPSEAVQSANGQKYFTKYPKFYRFGSASVGYMTVDERYTLEQLFFNVGVSTPFFIALDPLLNVAQDDDDLTKYVRFTDNLQMEHVFGQYFNVSIDLEEAL